MNERPTKRRGPITLLQTSQRFRLAVGLFVLLPVLYLLSFGPACWLASRGQLPLKETQSIYRPIVEHCEHGPECFQRPLNAWADVGSTRQGMGGFLWWFGDVDGVSLP